MIGGCGIKFQCIFMTNPRRMWGCMLTEWSDLRQRPRFVLTKKRWRRLRCMSTTSWIGEFLIILGRKGIVILSLMLQKPKVGEGGKKFQSIFRTEPQGLWGSMLTDLLWLRLHTITFTITSVDVHARSGSSIPPPRDDRTRIWWIDNQAQETWRSIWMQRRANITLRTIVEYYKHEYLTLDKAH